jgi:gas vesicle structural protein
MAKRPRGRPVPPRARLRSTVGPRPRHTTVAGSPPPRRKSASGKSGVAPGPHAGPPRRRATAKRQAGRIIDPDDSTLLEVIDNLLSKGVVLNAEVILALADVDLVYLRLSALLCAADRVLPPRAP